MELQDVGDSLGLVTLFGDNLGFHSNNLDVGDTFGRFYLRIFGDLEDVGDKHDLSTF